MQCHYTLVRSSQNPISRMCEVEATAGGMHAIPIHFVEEFYVLYSQTNQVVPPTKEVLLKSACGCQIHVNHINTTPTHINTTYFSETITSTCINSVSMVNCVCMHQQCQYMSTQLVSVYINMYQHISAVSLGINSVSMVNCVSIPQQ